MKAVLGILCLFICGVAYAGEPLSQSTLPEACNCALTGICVCPTGTCICPECPMTPDGVVLVAMQNRPTGFPAQAPAIYPPNPPPLKPGVPPTGYHYEYRQVCDGGKCRIIQVTVADLPNTNAKPKTATVVTTPLGVTTVPQVTATQSYKTTYSSGGSFSYGYGASDGGEQARTPFRNILHRLFNRKGNGGGKGICGKKG